MLQNINTDIPHINNNNKNNNFKWASNCPLCNAVYNQKEARIVAENKGAYLIYSKCKSCFSSIVATLVVNQMGINSIGLVTDLSYDDVVKFKDSKEITSDEILDIYNSLSENKIKFDIETDKKKQSKKN